MGRGRVQMKRIENKINRQVTFSKRKVGLLKKAHEISVLCDAEVAVIVFSYKGKVFEYSTDSCMEKILERYERHSFSSGQLTDYDPKSPENWSMDSTKLKSKIELLQQNHWHYVGEDLGSLSQGELQSLEQQIDTALKHIRSRKSQLMYESISELQRKEKAIKEQNTIIAKKIIKEKEKTIAQLAQWQQPNHGPNSSSLLLPEPLPYLGIGGIYQGEEPEMTNELELTLQPIHPHNLGYF